MDLLSAAFTESGIDVPENNGTKDNTQLPKTDPNLDQVDMFSQALFMLDEVNRDVEVSPNRTILLLEPRCPAIHVQPRGSSVPLLPCKMGSGFRLKCCAESSSIKSFNVPTYHNILICPRPHSCFLYL